MSSHTFARISGWLIISVIISIQFHNFSSAGNLKEDKSQLSLINKRWLVQPHQPRFPEHWMRAPLVGKQCHLKIVIWVNGNANPELLGSLPIDLDDQSLMRSTTPIKEKVWVQHGRAYIFEESIKDTLNIYFFISLENFILQYMKNVKKEIKMVPEFTFLSLVSSSNKIYIGIFCNCNSKCIL